MAPTTSNTNKKAAAKTAGTVFLTSSWFLFLAFTVGLACVPLKRLPSPSTPTFKSPPVPLEDMTDYHLRTAPFPTLFHLFLSLPPPSTPLDGEYVAEILDAGSLPANILGWSGFSPFFPGSWVGKAFVPAAAAEGEDGKSFGYNSFVWLNGKLYRRFKMATSVQPSTWDGKPSFELQYAGQKHLLGAMKMRDEVREIKPGLYLGMGTFGFTEAKRRQDPLPFVLRGPFHTAVPEEVKEGLF